MSSAASVTAISTPSRSGSATPVAQSDSAPTAPSVHSAQPVKAKDTVRQNVSTQAAASASPPTASANPNLPLGLLLSVGPPPSGNSVASSDYVAMQNALRTDNLVAAQQAYMRLQSDLQMDPTAEPATGAATSAQGGVLNVVA